jgi:hypothetical protein
LGTRGADAAARVISSRDGSIAEDAVEENSAEEEGRQEEGEQEQEEEEARWRARRASVCIMAEKVSFLRPVHYIASL